MFKAIHGKLRVVVRENDNAPSLDEERRLVKVGQNCLVEVVRFWDEIEGGGKAWECFMFLHPDLPYGPQQMLFGITSRYGSDVDERCSLVSLAAGVLAFPDPPDGYRFSSNG